MPTGSKDAEGQQSRRRLLMHGPEKLWKREPAIYGPEEPQKLRKDDSRARQGSVDREGGKSKAALRSAKSGSTPPTAPSISGTLGYKRQINLCA